MSTHSKQCKKENHLKLSQIQYCLQLWDFFVRDSKRVTNAVINEPSVFEPLELYCIEEQSQQRLHCLLMHFVSKQP